MPLANLGILAYSSLSVMRLFLTITFLICQSLEAQETMLLQANRSHEFTKELGSSSTILVSNSLGPVKISPSPDDKMHIQISITGSKLGDFRYHQVTSQKIKLSLKGSDKDSPRERPSEQATSIRRRWWYALKELIDFHRSRATIRSNQPGLQIEIVDGKVRRAIGFSAELRLLVPDEKLANLKVEVGYGDIHIEGLATQIPHRRFYIYTGNGAIDLLNNSALDGARLRSGFGGIIVRNFAGELNTQTTNGSIRLSSIVADLSKPGDEADRYSRVQSNFGEITARDFDGNLKLESKTGKIEVDGGMGHTHAKSLFGSIDIRNRVDGYVFAVTENGAIRLENPKSRGEHAKSEGRDVKGLSCQTALQAASVKKKKKVIPGSDPRDDRF